MARYESTYRFKDSFVGAIRKFGPGKGIYINTNSKASTKGQRSPNFTIALQRRDGLREFTTVGSATFPRNGRGTAKFLGQSGNREYRLRFEKSTDGIEVSGNITMFDA
ncbi:Uncharacterised protein [Niallia circulans]|nr:Uncharacterised protein [Niallia circulans]